MTFPFGGAGIGPFGLFAAGLEYETPLATERGQLPASRLIAATGKPVQADDGSGAFAGMPDTAQRVLLLLASMRLPKKITGLFAGSLDAEVRRVLRPLTSGASPAAVVLSVDYETERDITSTRVRYQDLGDGRVRVVKSDGTVTEL